MEGCMGQKTLRDKGWTTCVRIRRSFVCIPGHEREEGCRSDELHGSGSPGHGDDGQGPVATYRHPNQRHCALSQEGFSVIGFAQEGVMTHPRGAAADSVRIRTDCAWARGVACRMSCSVCRIQRAWGPCATGARLRQMARDPCGGRVGYCSEGYTGMEWRSEYHPGTLRGRSGHDPRCEC